MLQVGQEKRLQVQQKYTQGLVNNCALARQGRRFLDMSIGEAHTAGNHLISYFIMVKSILTS